MTEIYSYEGNTRLGASIMHKRSIYLMKIVRAPIAAISKPSTFTVLLHGLW